MPSNASGAGKAPRHFSRLQIRSTIRVIMLPYFLSSSVHWCFIADHCILLDVAQDRYLEVPAATFRELLECVAPHSPDKPSIAAREIPAEHSDSAKELLSVGVFTHTPDPGPRRYSPTLPKPAELISPIARGTSVRGAIRYLPQFLRACATADYKLRCTSLRAISGQTADRKSRHLRGHAATALEDAIRLTRIFLLLRPWYPRDYLCLFDSLALLEFLAHWRILPAWTFGVTADPFEAHCWVQYGDIVLSDTSDFSSRWFSPILVL